MLGKDAKNYDLFFSFRSFQHEYRTKSTKSTEENRREITKNMGKRNEWMRMAGGQPEFRDCLSKMVGVLSLLT